MTIDDVMYDVARRVAEEPEVIEARRQAGAAAARLARATADRDAARVRVGELETELSVALERDGDPDAIEADLDRAAADLRRFERRIAALAHTDGAARSRAGAVVREHERRLTAERLDGAHAELLGAEAALAAARAQPRSPGAPISELARAEAAQKLVYALATRAGVALDSKGHLFERHARNVPRVHPEAAPAFA